MAEIPGRGIFCEDDDMSKLKHLEIPRLYRIRRSDREKMYLTFLSAFRSYPKLLQAFPDAKERLPAVEATIRFYGSYDFRYGAGFSLDEEIREAVLMVHSDDMGYSLLRHLAAGSYGKVYRRDMGLLSVSDRRKWRLLFDELDRLEQGVNIPRPHLYLDFLGVRQECQHQGRGRKLMERVCVCADSIGLPMMLFTNTAEDVAFYESLGFHVIGQTSSATFGFTNTYMLYS